MSPLDAEPLRSISLYEGEAASVNLRSAEFRSKRNPEWNPGEASLGWKSPKASAQHPDPQAAEPSSAGESSGATSPVS